MREKIKSFWKKLENNRNNIETIWMSGAKTKNVAAATLGADFMSKYLHLDPVFQSALLEPDFEDVLRKILTDSFIGGLLKKGDYFFFMKEIKYKLERAKWEEKI